MVAKLVFACFLAFSLLNTDKWSYVLSLHMLYSSHVLFCVFVHLRADVVICLSTTVRNDTLQDVKDQRVSLKCRKQLRVEELEMVSSHDFSYRPQTSIYCILLWLVKSACQRHGMLLCDLFTFIVSCCLLMWKMIMNVLLQI